MAKIGGKLPSGPVQNMQDIFQDLHVASRKMLEMCATGGSNPETALAANPIKFSKTTTTLYQPPPKLGEHTEAILAEFNIEKKG